MYIFTKHYHTVSHFLFARTALSGITSDSSGGTDVSLCSATAINEYDVNLHDAPRHNAIK